MSKLALGAESAAALARSRTIDALVLKRSVFPEYSSTGVSAVLLTIARHARLTRNTSRNQNNLSIFESCLKTAWCWIVTSDCALGIDMADIGGDTFACKLNGLPKSSSHRHTWATLDIVESKLSDPRIELHQQRQWLPYATSGTENGNLGELHLL